ncbi:MAG: ATP-dependent DNA helicase RecG [Chloroflexota bacterium]|nr:ATP-dependent DNA helicase RecG [Chloroflexota bacterium]
MPSALETMVKILKLEREQGARNTAVVGGMSAYASTWQPQAHEQARRAEQHILIDEIVDILNGYERLETDDERIGKLNYLLDRATNRAPAPKEYADRIPDWQDKLKPPAGSSAEADRRRPPRKQGDRRQENPRRGSQHKRSYAYDSATYDEDFTGGPNAPRLDLPAMPRLARPPRQPRPQRSNEEVQNLRESLEAPATEVKGIGRKFAELLGQMNIFTVRDLLFNLPRLYRDYTELLAIRDLPAGEEATVIATITQTRVVSSGARGKDLAVRVSDGTGTLSIRFFRQDYLAAKLQRGMQVVLSGKVTYFRDMRQMTNPEWEELDSENLHTIGIVPVYRMTKGLRPRQFRRIVKTLVDEWREKIPDPLPTAILERAELADLGWALRQVHFPEGWDHRDHARKRLAFDELLMMQLALLMNRREWQSLPGPQLSIDDGALEAFISAAFPYDFTKAQNSAVADIRRDTASAVPMNRLLQGDVGCGKTAVAIVAMAMALHNGRQAAIMAPTGILAEQHYRSVQESFSRFSTAEKPVVALLTGALSASERELIYRGVADGSIDIVVGTHAVIQKGVEFHDLAIAVIDEQQRFGVDQRAALRGKGQNPHLLFMSATPYPRSIALTWFADLDITLMDEKPPGRQEVITKIMDPVARERLYGFVTAQLERGRQAFFIHPLVEESETLETADAMGAYERLSQVFFRFRVCLLHGRMSPSEKDALMSEFADGRYDVMVTTTVAEVGVDIPNASIITIEGANRFGLAQLHQFRGRVGRGADQAYCFLIPDEAAAIDIDRIRDGQAGRISKAEMTAAEQRLAAVEESNDGFHLAEVDLQLRGVGDLLGRRQSGQSYLQLLGDEFTGLAELSRREAVTIIEEDPALGLPEHQLLAERVSRLNADPGDVS